MRKLHTPPRQTKFLPPNVFALRNSSRATAPLISSHLPPVPPAHAFLPSFLCPPSFHAFSKHPLGLQVSPVLLWAPQQWFGVCRGCVVTRSSLRELRTVSAQAIHSAAQIQRQKSSTNWWILYWMLEVRWWEVWSVDAPLYLIIGRLLRAHWIPIVIHLRPSCSPMGRICLALGRLCL